jgi:uracil-DNA glycosylase
MLSSLDNTQDYTRSAIQWWSMAGVDYDVMDQPQSWLEENVGLASAEITPPLTHNSVQSAAIIPERSAVTLDQWPQTITALQMAQIEGFVLPGNNFGGKTVSSIGYENAALMIVSDIPEEQDIQTGTLFSGASGQLLINMMAAIGLGIYDYYLTCLATSRPASGEIPSDKTSEIKSFILHQVELVQPKSVLILGTTACKALLGADLMAARGCLENINYNGQKVSTVTTFHPRTLLAQPMLKAQAWKDLQMLMTKGVL